jgi:asparagine synthase (glutamine-hydrolysing)
MDGNLIQLHKGLFEDTWPNANIGSIALAHIDCDWYDPVKYCLEAIADKMSPSGLIVIDDYHAFGGARTAVDEFIESRPDFEFLAGPNPILRRI